MRYVDFSYTRNRYSGYILNVELVRLKKVKGELTIYER